MQIKMQGYNYTFEKSEGGLCYIYLTENTAEICKTIEVGNSVRIDLDIGGGLVGIEFEVED